MTHADDWIEVSCSLFPGPDGTAHIPWQPLADALGGWRAEGLLQAFWFVRKMPGLKLRLRGGARQPELETELARWLAAAERCNDLRGYRFTRYEAEEYRFGGAAGLEVAHRHFDAGARAVIEYHAALAAGQSRLAPHEWSFANTSDLLQRALHDKAEMWDVWCRLRGLLPSSADAVEWPDAAKAAAGWSPLIGDLLAFDSDLAQAAMAANDATATDLAALAEGGRLGVGLREWLAAATTFDWNRWGLPSNLPALARALDAAVALWRPDQSQPRCGEE